MVSIIETNVLAPVRELVRNTLWVSVLKKILSTATLTALVLLNLNAEKMGKNMKMDAIEDVLE